MTACSSKIHKTEFAELLQQKIWGETWLHVSLIQYTILENMGRNLVTRVLDSCGSCCKCRKQKTGNWTWTRSSNPHIHISCSCVLCCTQVESLEYHMSHKPVSGVTLIESDRSEKFPAIPKLFVECIEFVEKGGNIKLKGIYRASGNKSINLSINSNAR